VRFRGVKMKYNPFKPNDMVNTGMFVGRIDEIESIESYLFQSKCDNAQNFIVQGERGIGKSSLFFYISALARGSIDIDGEDKFNFLVIETDLGGCATQLDLARKVGRGLKTAVSSREKLKKAASAFWNWLTNWEILGVKYNKANGFSGGDVDAEEVCEELAQKLADLCKEARDELDGILVLIDEADGPSSEAGLGEFLKMLSERLSKFNCHKVMFGLAGLPVIMKKLRESHESSPRLFHSMRLDPLEFDERKKVVVLGLQEANAKNKHETKITDGALELLATLSEGYPHFLQQFAYSAFESDTDYIITESDVETGAFKDGGALAQLGDKFFNEMYHARISSEDYRRVLDAMAKHGDEWISRKKIIQESRVSEVSVNNALQALKVKQIILSDEARRGYYKLPTNSFAAWINAIHAAKTAVIATGSATDTTKVI